MAEAGRAVFLSYASQDAEAVARIAEALRAAGVEVWFDQNELVGGDAWDAKIRGQIANCALFVPVISANTQARREGYFRLEWKLGAQRTHMIADGTPFLLPVVIDATRDAEALVPAEFKAVQWTRLRRDLPADGGASGEAGARWQVPDEAAIAAFCTQVRLLLPGPGAPPISSRPSRGAGLGSARSESPRSPSIPDYELIRPIGQGGYGEVWLARGLTGAYCAVKTVQRNRFSDAEPFEREFRGLKESVGAVIGRGRGLALLHVGRDEAAGFFYYVMELADDAERGRAVDPASYVPLTLKELRRRRGRLPVAEVRKLGEEVGADLAALHARGLVHRDIKPSNIIVVNGAAKLADIGLVASATEAMSFVGTEGFVPPEGPGTPAADVFALGKVLYELATGFDRQVYPKLPTTFAEPKEQAELFELNEILLRACETEVGGRYRDGVELLADFAALGHGRSLRDRRGGAKRWWPWAAAAAVLSAGGWLGTWIRPPGGVTPPDPGPPPEIAATPAANSIAVLPFANLSGDKAQDLFSDGITQEILGALRRERDLWVPGDTSCFAFKGRSIAAADIGKALNVARLVEGSVRRDGNRVRISVTLTRASDGFSEEVGTFTEESGNIFALQEKLARTVVAKVTRREPTTVYAAGTRNPEAYDLYLRGRSLQIGGLTPTAGIDMVKTYEQAVALDAGYALAWARLSQAYTRMRSGGRDASAKNAADARNAAATALRLAPDLAEAHLAMARIHFTYDRDLDAAERALDAVDRLGPNDAEALALRASVKRARGERGEDLVRLIARSAERDPQNSDTLVFLGGMFRQIGRFAEAHRLYERARAVADIGIHRRPQAGNWVTWTGDAAGAGKFLDATPEGSFDAVLLGLERAELRAMVGDFAGAIADYERLRQLEAARANVAVPDYRFDELIAPLAARLGQNAGAKERWTKVHAVVQAAAEKAPDHSKFAGRLAFAHARSGGTDAARTWMKKWLETPAPSPIGRRLDHAELLTVLGDIEAAIAELRALHEEGHPFGYLLRLKLEWEALRGDPKFKQLMKEAEARADAQPRPRTGLVSAATKTAAAPAPAPAADRAGGVGQADGAAGARPPGTADKSLVVLTLENLSPDPANAFFTDGLHAEIIATLARLPDLKVTSRATAQVFKGVPTPLAELGRRLGVANVLGGSVRREGQNVRVQLELRRASDEAVLWQKTFSRDLQPGFALQDEIGADVARILQARADAGWYAGAKFMTKNPAAYDLFLKARELPFLRGPSLATFDEQRRLAEEALQLDPEFMSAASLLSSAYSYAYTAEPETAKRKEHAANARRWAERAAELVPGGAGDGALAVYYGMVERDPARALAFAENEVRALPNDANGHNRVGANLAEFGRLEEALAAYERALALDPLNVRVLHNRIYPLAHLRRIPEFEAAVARSLELGGKNVSRQAIADYRYRLTGKLPESVEAAGRALSESPAMLWYARRFDEVPAAADAALAGAPPLPPEGRFELLRLKGGAYRKLGRSDVLATTAREMLALAESQRPSGGGDRSGYDRMRMWALAYADEPTTAVAAARRYVEAATGPGRVLERWEREHELARLYAWFGRKRECAEILTKLVRLPTLVTVPYLALAPDWDDVRDDPDMRAIFVDPRNRQPL